MASPRFHGEIIMGQGSAAWRRGIRCQHNKKPKGYYAQHSSSGIVLLCGPVWRLTQASRRMPYGLTQSAISRQMRDLELQSTTALFRRRPFALTPSGEMLYAFISPFSCRPCCSRCRTFGAAAVGPDGLSRGPFWNCLSATSERTLARSHLACRGSGAVESRPPHECWTLPLPVGRGLVCE
jgi:hypothetical protein